jgi:hypothetical protein
MRKLLIAVAIMSSSRLSVDAAGKLTIDGTVDVNGKVTAGCFTGSGSGLVGAR